MILIYIKNIYRDRGRCQMTTSDAWGCTCTFIQIPCSHRHTLHTLISSMGCMWFVGQVSMISGF